MQAGRHLGPAEEAPSTVADALPALCQGALHTEGLASSGGPELPGTQPACRDSAGVQRRRGCGRYPISPGAWARGHGRKAWQLGWRSPHVLLQLLPVQGLEPADHGLVHGLQPLGVQLPQQQQDGGQHIALGAESHWLSAPTLMGISRRAACHATQGRMDRLRQTELQLSAGTAQRG